MRLRWFVFIPFVLLTSAAISSSGQREIPNALIPNALIPNALIPNALIDESGFRADVIDAHQLRESRRITESEFVTLAAAPGAVILDARSRHRFDQMHMVGARHLNFADFTEEALAEVIPSKDTTVLIYCNNNIDPTASAREAFPTKSFRAALNLSTYVSLYTYGYRNVYELGPVVDPDRSVLRFEGSLVN